jgi:hypothetical protein
LYWLDRESGAVQPLSGTAEPLPGFEPSASHPFAWLAGDVLVYAASADGVRDLRAWRAGRGSTVLGPVTGELNVEPSPGRRRLAIVHWEPNPAVQQGQLAPVSTIVAVEVYDAETGALTAVDRTWHEWAGPATLARRTNGRLELHALAQ